MKFIGKKLNIEHNYNQLGEIILTTKIKLYPVFLSIEKFDEKQPVFGLNLINKSNRIDTKHNLLNKKLFYSNTLDKIKFEKLNIDTLLVKKIKPWEILNDLKVTSITITSYSKGKGFSGVVKRYKFKEGPMSHGSKKHRIIGSIGAGTNPGHVFKNKKMAGQMGNKKITMKNVQILKLENNILTVLGSFPGYTNSILILTLN